MTKARKNEHQFNVKQTETEWQNLQRVNQKHFGGKLTPTELGRFLLKVALDALVDAKVETKEVILVNGNPVDIR